MSHLATPSEMRVEYIDGGAELKWCLFTKGIRGSIAKIVIDTKLKGKIQDPENPTAHVVAVFVKPEYRGQRLADQLVLLAQENLRENGFVWLTLEAEEKVSHHGKLVALYERCGFEVFPVSENYPLEYNDDECYRKVPMRCNLVKLIPSNNENVTNPYLSLDFVQEMRREALRLISSSPMNLNVYQSLEWIEGNLQPGSMEKACRSACLVRNQGHPDWMELAAYLRYLGRIQEKWTSWHAPYMVHIAEDRNPSDDSSSSDDNDDELRRNSSKSGDLSQLLTSINPVFIDPQNYSHQGVDEAVLSWGPSEFAYLGLTFGERCSAPHEMAQLLRYMDCNVWLNGDEFSYIEAWHDRDSKDLTNRFKSILNAADASPSLDAQQLEDSKVRLFDLIEKYVHDVQF